MKQFFVALLMLGAFSSYAGIQVDATRVIYKGADKSASLPIQNDASEAYMVQTWLDTGDKSQVPKNLPIVVVPPILKMDAGKTAILRFIYSGTGLPQDKETLLWINVQEIPPSPKLDNVLQIAVRTRIKLFYRPDSLNTSLEKQVKKLRWQRTDSGLQVINDGPLHITFGVLKLKNRAGKTVNVEANMVKPGGRLSFKLPADVSLSKGVSFSYINDFGGKTEVRDVAVQ
ncbi:fimbrial biogenesis chaperone [Pantoea coffeiphila]|uniref:Fimbrial protein n=1 Tax=Pantoea coffeiphila TaxID=1465635 RepID=A0A2S9ID96_9GAMM|nr:molecular chaperone [Pantoea coffeiphila]PRD15704.1 fimbrial protein [Pantoea coffeiphila]